jgi:hypothetical protein
MWGFPVFPGKAQVDTLPAGIVFLLEYSYLKDLEGI